MIVLFNPIDIDCDWHSVAGFICNQECHTDNYRKNSVICIT